MDDLEEIKKLKARYFRSLDSKDWETYAGVFAEDCAVDLTGTDSATGVWGLEDYNIWEDGSQNHGWGHYLETYVKREGRWYIKTMALSYLRIDRECPQPVLVAGVENTGHLRGLRPAAAG